MHKLKILTGLALLTCAIATTTTTPANAEFQSGTQGGPNQRTTGTLTLPASSTLSVGAGGSVKCLNGGATGYWTIQTSEETVSANGEIQTQPPTKRGPHESLTIQKWGICFFSPNGTTTFAATVSECRLQIAQTTKGSKSPQPALGSVQTNCTISIPAASCVVTIPQSAANHGLGPIQISHALTGVEISSTVTGQSYKAPAAGCIGISKTGADGEFKSIGTIALEQALV